MLQALQLLSLTFLSELPRTFTKKKTDFIGFFHSLPWPWSINTALYGFCYEHACVVNEDKRSLASDKGQILRNEFPTRFSFFYDLYFQPIQFLSFLFYLLMRGCHSNQSSLRLLVFSGVTRDLGVFDRKSKPWRHLITINHRACFLIKRQWNIQAKMVNLKLMLQRCN